jgi:hypothetical protein
MAHDPTATPTAVLRRYQQEIWDRGELDKLAEIVANPYRRHYPGKIEILTNDELAERVRFFRRGLHDVVFHSILEVAEGPYVTTAWETLGTTRKGQRLCTSGIEIFKVESGFITDVWNGHAQDGLFAWNLKWDRPVREQDFLDVKERVKNWGQQTTAD